MRLQIHIVLQGSPRRDDGSTRLQSRHPTHSCPHCATHGTNMSTQQIRPGNQYRSHTEHTRGPGTTNGARNFSHYGPGCDELYGTHQQDRQSYEGVHRTSETVLSQWRHADNTLERVWARPRILENGDTITFHLVYDFHHRHTGRVCPICCSTSKERFARVAWSARYEGLRGYPVQRSHTNGY